MWNAKAKVIPAITGATGTFSKSITQYLSNIPGKQEFYFLSGFAFWHDSFGGPGSSVGIATGYGLDGSGI
jgi:hypothetical protein